ncbi:MAG: DUF2018 family protein [Epsilonproteobacteria bacterium]|nr:DUF2018 family protein [Campylobacterota bacterium]
MFAALLEDENDIFGGTPKSKFMDVIFHANNDIVRQELEKMVYRMAAMEVALEKQGQDVDEVVKEIQFEAGSEVEDTAKSIYIEVMGNILSQSE